MKTDNARYFTSQKFQDFCEYFGISHRKITPLRNLIFIDKLKGMRIRHIFHEFQSYAPLKYKMFSLLSTFRKENENLDDSITKISRSDSICRYKIDDKKAKNRMKSNAN